jgi:hypothetical protein
MDDYNAQKLKEKHLEKTKKHQDSHTKLQV